MKKVIDINFKNGYEISEEEIGKLDDNRRSIQSFKIELLKKNKFSHDEITAELEYIENRIEELIFKIKGTTKEKEFLESIKKLFDNMED